MIENFSEFVKILARKKVTADQFVFLYLTHTNDFTSLYRYISEVRKFELKELEDLEDRGYLINLNPKSNQTFADNYIVGDKFLEGILLPDAEKAAQEFWDAYPAYAFFNAKRAPLKSCDKEKFTKMYVSKIKYSTHEHLRILAALDYAKRNELTNMSIVNWIASEQWKEVEKVQSSDPGDLSHDTLLE